MKKIFKVFVLVYLTLAAGTATASGGNELLPPAMSNNPTMMALKQSITKKLGEELSSQPNLAEVWVHAYREEGDGAGVLCIGHLKTDDIPSHLSIDLAVDIRLNCRETEEYPPGNEGVEILQTAYNVPEDFWN